MNDNLDIPEFLKRPRTKRKVDVTAELRDIPLRMERTPEEKAKDQKADNKKTAPKPPVNIQLRVLSSSYHLYGQIDDIFDKVWVDSATVDANAVYDHLMKHQPSTQVADKALIMVRDHALQYKKFPEDYGRPRKKYAEFWGQAIDALERYITNKSKIKVRKPRKRKAKSAEKKVVSFKFCERFDTYKIGSVHPTKVIGAVQVWLFDHKSKRLTMLNAVDRGGIDIKGQTFLNVDESTSITKRVGRKTQQVLDGICHKSKPQCKNLLKDIKAKDMKLQTRSNATTVILRVF